jgi:hypothetical protein
MRSGKPCNARAAAIIGLIVKVNPPSSWKDNGPATIYSFYLRTKKCLYCFLAKYMFKKGTNNSIFFKLITCWTKCLISYQI